MLPMPLWLEFPSESYLLSPSTHSSHAHVRFRVSNAQAFVYCNMFTFVMFFVIIMCLSCVCRGLGSSMRR